MERPSLIMVHGAGGGAWEWQRWQRVAEAAGWSVFAAELMPGNKALEDASLDDYQAQLAEWVQRFPHCVLVGASLGGLLALRAPPVRARVLVNPLLPQSLGGGAGRSWPARVRWSQAGVSGTVAAMADAETSAAPYAHARWRDESGRVLQQAQDLPHFVPADCPTLVISGELDEDTAPAGARLLASDTGADFVQVPGASHLGPLLGDSAAACAALVLAWLELQPSARRD